MKHVSFELTMPNVGSWNGKWTGADKKYYIIKKFSDRFFKDQLEKLLDNGKTYTNYYYSWNDGWGANVKMEVIDAADGRKRQKMSKGFAGYDWMVSSIIKYGGILNSSQIKELI
jgi:hypothetical protein